MGTADHSFIAHWVTMASTHADLEGSAAELEGRGYVVWVALDPSRQVANKEQARLPHWHGCLGRGGHHVHVRQEGRDCMDGKGNG